MLISKPLACKPIALSISLALLSLVNPLTSFADAPSGVQVKFDLSDPANSPFPSNRFTVREWSNKSLRRVNLPTPNCAVQVSDCQDIAVINTLDGFSTQPRITVPFTGAIDPASVTSDTVFLLSLGDAQTGRGLGSKVGINQRLWDPATNTMVFESDELLQESTRYVLIVTDGVRDTAGKAIKKNKFDDDDKATQSAGNEEYIRELRDAVRAHRGAGKVVAATVFTTQTSTGDLAKIMRQIKARTPAPASFMIGSSGGTAVRSVFNTANVAGIQFNRQVGTAPAFDTGFLPTPALNVVPGSVGQVAYGKFSSPNYQVAGQYIPATATGNSGNPLVQSTNDLVFQLFVPAGSKPAAGWPVAIFGHGFTDSMYGAPWTVASVFASQGIATLSINVVGHGGGALGNLNVFSSAGGAPVNVPAGGRGIDQDGSGVIDSTEGVNATAPRTIIGSRDGLRQTVIDLMQLVRQVEVGIDIDGDGTADLNAQRIYYAGQSFGGIYGTKFLGIEPNLKAGVPNVPGGSITEVARLGAFRFLTAIALGTRTPQLLNLAPTGAPFPFNLAFNENMPLRDLAPVVNNVPGATAIAQVLDRFEWVQQSGNPVSYAPLIRKSPLLGSAAKPVIIQFAKGDVTVPNPTTSAILRAGALQDRATYFRNDLANALNPLVPKNPHTFLTNIGATATVSYAVQAQSQIAAFFASNGALTIDPDGPGQFFEVPIALPLPESTNFIP
jgi:hypothetical protein